jgi:hypothetical protein
MEFILRDKFEATVISTGEGLKNSTLTKFASGKYVEKN